jgi:hypothetical protein
MSGSLVVRQIAVFYRDNIHSVYEESVLVFTTVMLTLNLTLATATPSWGTRISQVTTHLFDPGVNSGIPSTC